MVMLVPGYQYSLRACLYPVSRGNREPLRDEVKVTVSGEQKLAFSPNRWQALEQHLMNGLADFHEKFPDEMGPETSRARRMFLPKLATSAFTALAEDLLAKAQIKRSGPFLHLPDHRVSLTPQEEILFERILPWLQETPYDPPWVRDLAKRCNVDENRMRQLMQKLARQGSVFQVVRDLFYAPEALAELAAIVTELDQTKEGASAAAFRDRTGIGRKRCVQLLEFFDRVGYTRRMRDTHHLRNPGMFGGNGMAGHA